MTDQTTPGADPRVVIRLLSQEVARLTELATIAEATVATLTSQQGDTEPDTAA